MKHCILIFGLCIVGQFMNGYSLSGVLRRASKSDESGNSDEDGNKMNHQIAKGVIIYTKDFDGMRLEIPNKGNQSDDDDSGNDGINPDYMEEDDVQDNEEDKNVDDNDNDEENDGYDDADDNKRNPTNDTDNITMRETFKRFVNEMKFGDTADLLGHNQHIFQSPIYMDLGRRFVPQYKYSDVNKETAAEHNGDLIPEKAPPELVLVVAKESALLGPDKENDLGDIDQKKILRSGDYWNSVWKEEVKTPLRSAPEKKVLVYKETAAEHNGDLIPEKAPPELVLVVAKESALLGPDKENDLGDIDQKKILRSGDYWNSVWKEEVDVKTPLRSAPEKKVLGSIKAKIKPGTEFHKVVSRMKKMSPRLLYIINKKLH